MTAKTQSNDGDGERRRAVGAARRAKTKLALVKAAARVVALYGEENVKIDDFVAAAGVARGTFYNYYATREELLVDLWARVGFNPLEEIWKATAVIEDPAERLATETIMVLERAAEDPIWGWAVYGLTEAQPDPHDAHRRPGQDLSIGQMIGRFRFEHLGSAQDVVTGALRAALRKTLEFGANPDYIASVALMLLVGLGIDRDEARSIIEKRSIRGSAKTRPKTGRR